MFERDLAGHRGEGGGRIRDERDMTLDYDGMQMGCDVDWEEHSRHREEEYAVIFHPEGKRNSPLSAKISNPKPPAQIPSPIRSLIPSAG